MGVLNMLPAKGEPTEVKEAVDDTVTEENETPAEPSTAENETGDEADEDGTSVKTVVETPAAEEPEEELTALEQQKQKLLDEIVELRGQRRTVRRQKHEPEVIVTDDLKGIAPEDVSLVEKVLKAKGYVRKEDLGAMSYAEKATQAQDDWLKEHPEYLPANDPDDAKWNALNKTVTSYFKSPANPGEVRKVLDLAHQMLSPGALPVRAKAQTDSAQEKLRVQSKGRGGQGVSKTPSQGRRNIDTSYLHGFSDEELEEMVST